MTAFPQVYGAKTMTEIRHQDWREDAACQFHDQALFSSPVKEDLPEGKSLDYERRRRQAAAKDICRSCPVRWPCLQDALENPDPHAGVRGGYTPYERKDAIDVIVVADATPSEGGN